MSTASRLAFFVILAAAIVTVGAVAAAPARAAIAPGDFVWTVPVDPTGSYDDLSRCVLGPGRTLYACGGQGWPGAIDILVVKYNASGTEAWTRTWAGPDGLADNSEGMAVDGAGNVYVCGSTQRTNGTTDSLLLKYDAGGALKWAVTYDPAGTSDEARAVGMDADGRVYVAGWCYHNATGSDAYVARFRASNGARRWTSWYRGSGYDVAFGIAVTSGGSSYASGESDPVGRKGDALLVKTTAAGKRAWARRWSGKGDRMDNWERIALGGGGVYVTGETDYLGAGNLAAARYSAAGKLLWARTWGAANGHRDSPGGIAVDRGDNVWVAGSTRLTDTAWQTLLIKWRPSGALRFSRVMGSVTVPMALHDVAVDSGGNAYAVGTWNRIGPGGFNLLAVKYSPTGKRVWRTYRDGAGYDDRLFSVVLAGSTSLYACGALGVNQADSQAAVVRIAR
jgi:hypothetical protein